MFKGIKHLVFCLTINYTANQLMTNFSRILIVVLIMFQMFYVLAFLTKKRGSENFSENFHVFNFGLNGSQMVTTISRDEISHLWSWHYLDGLNLKFISSYCKIWINIFFRPNKMSCRMSWRWAKTGHRVQRMQST